MSVQHVIARYWARPEGSDTERLYTRVSGSENVKQVYDSQNQWVILYTSVKPPGESYHRYESTMWAVCKSLTDPQPVTSTTAESSTFLFNIHDILFSFFQMLIVWQEKQAAPRQFAIVDLCMYSIELRCLEMSTLFPLNPFCLLCSSFSPFSILTGSFQV